MPEIFDQEMGCFNGFLRKSTTSITQTVFVVQASLYAMPPLLYICKNFLFDVYTPCLELFLFACPIRLHFSSAPPLSSDSTIPWRLSVPFPSLWRSSRCAPSAGQKSQFTCNIIRPVSPTRFHFALNSDSRAENYILYMRACWYWGGKIWSVCPQLPRVALSGE